MDLLYALSKKLLLFNKYISYVWFYLPEFYMSAKLFY